MVIILTVFLAGAQVLPQIDRRALELQARAEALQPRGRTAARSRQQPQPARTTSRTQLAARSQTPAPRKPVAQPAPQSTRTAAAHPAPAPQRQIRTASAPTAAQRRIQPRRATGGGPLDLASITTICRAAGNQEDPAGFIARLSTAYSLSDADSVSLRASCAAYLAGRADARRASGGTY